MLCVHRAWVYGVFGNELRMIAFRKVVFAILDDRKRKTMDRFVREFGMVFGSKVSGFGDITL